MRLPRKARFFWVYPLAVWLFATARTSEASIVIGGVFVVLGESLRLWANGYVGHVKVNWTQKWRNDPKIGRLITAGPYAHVRHPLYVGTLIIGMGFCIAVKSVWVALGGLALFLILYRAKAQREEALIFDEWGKEYETYQQAVPRWWPSARGYAHRHGECSWQGIYASKELKTLIWVVVGLLVLYFREEFLQEHELFAGKSWVKHVGLVIFCVSLMALDGLIELRRWLARRSPRGSGAAT